MSTLTKRAWAEFNKLKGLNVNSDSLLKFIIDSSPYDDETVPPTNYTFLERILPMSEPFSQSAFKIEIKLPNSYPIEPPDIRLLTPIYHPNVNEKGIVCLAILDKTNSWKSSIFLTDVLKQLLDIIDHPNLERPADDNIADEYLHKKNEYDRKALEMVQKNLLSRS